jgi:hypothetical protein
MINIFQAYAINMHADKIRVITIPGKPISAFPISTRVTYYGTPPATEYAVHYFSKANSGPTNVLSPHK